MLWLALAWQQEEHRQRHMIALVRGAIEQIFSERITESVTALHKLRGEVLEAQGEMGAVQALIDQEITRKGGALRIAWSDADRKLRVGTIVGVFQEERESYPAPPPVDLSHRDYIQKAQEAPGVIYVSELAAHAITGRSFFAIALGIAEGKQYLGCLASIVDVSYLRELLTRSSMDGAVGVLAVMPDGAVLFDNHRPQDSRRHKMETAEGFSIALYSPSYGAGLLLRFIPVALISTLVFVFLAGVFQHFFIRPLEAISHYVLELPAQDQQFLPEGGSDQEILVKAEAIRTLLADYFYTKKETREHRQNLSEAVRLIHVMHEEHSGIMSSLGRELEEIFLAINRYAAFIEGQVQEDHSEPEAYLEEIKECGLNLKFLSNSFYLICKERLGYVSLRSEPVDIESCIASVRELVEDALGLRGIDLACRGELPHPLWETDPTRLKHILWGVVYLAVRYADDNQTVGLGVSQTEQGKLHFSLTVARCMEAYVPAADVTLDAFFPSYRRTQLERVESMISQHANMLVIRHFAQQLGGSVTLALVMQEDAIPGYRIEVEIA